MIDHFFQRVGTVPLVGIVEIRDILRLNIYFKPKSAHCGSPFADVSKLSFYT